MVLTKVEVMVVVVVMMVEEGRVVTVDVSGGGDGGGGIDGGVRRSQYKSNTIKGYPNYKEKTLQG